ncbi:ras GTPase-activating-like protein IQGAP1 isoform X1 [Lethenteron reissneri]|uniref:ras GTPase-activating-like protein IQGAP1 isoform X1 n=1 Tax=Lethenteron reissneri TaxID=7753 RepID=UPI002AB7D669|nr:ras GTPase-activating-like protein IQGAP1 isoform X1 [Lethenteron reissneri]
MSVSDEMDSPGYAAGGRPQYGSVLDNERMSAEEMDERRKQNIAYEYLCHLEEAKQWMEACLNEELPPTTELEEGLMNGVFLSKLGNFFAPEVVSLRKIYDKEQTRYKAMGLHFRHTDNIIHWLRAMEAIGLPKIFYPETTDIYDRKNMPRSIYCIHALSLYLFKLGIAPQIQDLYGKVNFTEEEINNMRKELEKYGIQMPAFSKIGGILANELSVDEAALHAAVIAINEAIDHGVAKETMVALRNPNAMLVNLNEPLSPVYQETLLHAKQDKATNARNKSMSDASSKERDVYEELLTQAEIQGNINKVNMQAALEQVDEALEKRDEEAMILALKLQALALTGVQSQNSPWYLEQLSSDRQLKGQESGSFEPLSKDELQSGVRIANEESSRHKQKLKAISHCNEVIRRGVAADTVVALMQSEAQLPDVHPFAADLYQSELAALQTQSPSGELAHEEMYVAVEMLSAVALINQALSSGDRPGVWKGLTSPAAGLANLEDENTQKYIDSLLIQKTQSAAQGKEFLTWNDIQSGVEDVNGTVQQEHERIVAIGLINDALDSEDPQKILKALQHPAAKLLGVDPSLARHYQNVLRQAKANKAKANGDPSAVLWLEEIQEAIYRANKQNEETQRLAVAVAAINIAVDEGDASQTFSMLRSQDVGLRGVVEECSDTYQSELYDAKQEKMVQGDNGSQWVQHRTREGFDYYFNLQELHGTWEQPKGFVQNNTQLNREDIQNSVSQVTAAYNREQMWLAHEPTIVKLQAQCRGFLARRSFQAKRDFFQEQVPAITKIQATWRGFKQKKAYQNRLKELHSDVPSVVKLQSLVRMWRDRKKYQERKKYYRDNMESIVKIQAFLRANKAREDYRTLISAEDAPVNVVRKFVHLLEQNDLDFHEELEVMRCREEVMTNIRSNQQLEQDLNTMDIKIGLLVKNRITLEDVVSHSTKLKKKNKEQVAGMMVADKQKGLKSLSKEKRQKLEAYQHLFYLLQTNPTYLAKLIFQMPQNRSTKFMDAVIFSLYNYGSNLREEYLLLKLFKTALEEEIKSKVDQMQDIVTGNPTVIKMVVSFNRGTRGQNALRQLLGPLVKEVIEDKALNINTNPVEVYKAWVNQMESQTGEASNLPYDVAPEQALAHDDVKKRMETSIRNLRMATDKFLVSIFNSLDNIPYGMRYIAKVLKNSLREKFPDATDDELLKIVGNLLYYRYMNPAIVAPDGFDIIDMSAGGQLHSDQRRNLGSVAKVLQFAASNKIFEGDSAHLASMNAYLSEASQKFRKFFQAACEVPEPEDKFSIDEYSDLVTVSKPVIYTTVGELINTHSLLLEHEDAIAPDHNDPLHELLLDLGEVPNLQALIGEGGGDASDPNKEAQLAKTEMSLTLTSKFEVPEGDDSNMKSLLLKTKRLIVDVIRVQPGDTLAEILKTPATSEQEVEHAMMIQRRTIMAAKTPEKMKGGQVLAEADQPLDKKKRTIAKNLKILESASLVSSAANYQQLINDIAKDIRNQRRYRQRRKAELVKLQQTLNALNSKTTFYEEQIDYYNKYIKTCLDNLARSGKNSRRSVHQGSSAKGSSGKKVKQTNLRYTAARLHEKGVLLEIEGLQPSQFKNVLFDISPSDEVGDFDVRAKFMGVEMEKVQLHFQDLLQLQYEGVAVMKIFDKAKVNVNLLIFLLNKKFYGK